MLRSSPLVVAAAAALAGCLSPDPDPATGQIGLSLVGQAENGTSFRLRHATITVAGTTDSRTFTTEDAPDRTAIVERLATGAYTVGLAGSWRLEQLAADGASTPVTASLLSPNPQAFTIAADAVTRVALRFGVPGGEVELGEGDLELGVDVDVLPEPQLQAVVTDATVVGLVEGGHHVVAVRLAAAPAADVVVTATADDAAAIAVAPTSLTFTTAAWNQPQFVEIAARHDVDVGDVSTAVRLSAADATPATVAVTVLDDDVLAPVLTSIPSTIDEGQSVSIRVQLDHRPLVAIAVTVASTHPAVLSASPASLTFTPDDWQTAQWVTLAALDDADFDDADVTVTATVGDRSEGFVVAVRDTTEIAVGWTGVPPDVTAVPAGVITFYEVTIDGPVDIDRIGIVARGSAVVQLGLYATQTFRLPGSLVYATVPRSLRATLGLVDIAAFPQTSSRTIGPGTYWLAVVADGAFDIATAAIGAPLAYRCRRSTSDPSLPAFISGFPIPTCGQERSVGLAGFGRP